MIHPDEMQRVKAQIRDKTGKRVTLMTRKGKKRSSVRHGVIEGAYNSVFVVMLDSAIEELPESTRRVSFRYTDLLTHAIEVQFTAEGTTTA